MQTGITTEKQANGGQAIDACQKEKKEERRLVYLQPSYMQLAETWRQDWVINAPEGVIASDVTKPAFWSLVSVKMRPFDRVEIRAFDGTWLIEGVVLGCDRTWARIHPLHEHNFTSKDVSMTQAQEEIEVAYKGPTIRWCLIRSADGVRIKENLETKDAAEAAKFEYLKGAR